VASSGPLFELRYRPQWRSAALFVNGQPRSEGYLGHHQFQGQDGGIAWGVGASGNGDARAAGSFHVVWLEIY
jgi:hypothetical protein